MNNENLNRIAAIATILALVVSVLALARDVFDFTTRSSTTSYTSQTAPSQPTIVSSTTSGEGASNDEVEPQSLPDPAITFVDSGNSWIEGVLQNATRGFLRVTYTAWIVITRSWFGISYSIFLMLLVVSYTLFHVHVGERITNKQYRHERIRWGVNMRRLVVLLVIASPLLLTIVYGVIRYPI